MDKRGHEYKRCVYGQTQPLENFLTRWVHLPLTNQAWWLCRVLILARTKYPFIALCVCVRVHREQGKVCGSSLKIRSKGRKRNEGRIKGHREAEIWMEIKVEVGINRGLIPVKR